MDRLYHSILVGVLLGVAGAIWVPRERVAEWAAWLAQARVQPLTPPAAASEPGGEAVAGDPGASRLASRYRQDASGTAVAGDYWEESDAQAADEAAQSASGALSPRERARVRESESAAFASDDGDAAPEATDPTAPMDDAATGFEAAGPSPEENALLSADINRLESAQIIAYVGPEVVLAAEVLPRAAEFVAAHLDRIPPDQVDAQVVRVMQQLLPGVIETKAVYAEARREIPAEGWTGIQKQLDEGFEQREIPRLMKRCQAGSRAELVAYLAAHGSSLEQEKRTYTEREVARGWVQQKLPQEKEVTHEEALAWYREHLADYEREAKVRWEQLTVRFDRFADKAAAWREMARMGNAVLDGTPLAEVARAASHGLTASRGGQRDWTRAGSLASRVLDEALFTLPVGQLSPILEDEQGFHIVRVVERQEAGRVPFEEAQVEIRKKIQEERKQQAIDDYLAEVVARTRVVTIFDPPAEDTAPETAAARPAPGSRGESDVQR